MEFLKKIFIVLTLTIAVNAVNAQDSEKIIDAFKKSYEMEEKGEYNQALSELKSVYNEDSYELNLRIAWLSYQSGKFNESTAFYNKAINLKPYAIEARFGITYPLSALGKWNQIINQYKKILEIDENNTTANYKLGSIYYSRKKYDLAEKHFMNVINLYPFDYDSLLMLAWTKLQQGQNGKAKVLFNKVLMYNPDDESALEGLELIN